LIWIIILAAQIAAWAGSTVPSQPMPPHMVSLSPSNTELIYSLGAQNHLVGRCNQCDYPPQCKSLEVVGSFTSANLEKLARVHPDRILTVSGQEAVTSSLKHIGFKVTELNNNRLHEIPNNLRTLGALTGSDQRAQELASQFEISIKDLSAIIEGSKTRPSIFYCIWPNPLLTVGSSSFINDCITICGAKNIAGEIKTPYPHYSVERLLLKNPDVIILPCEARAQHLERQSPWNSLRAFREKKVFYLPDAKSDMMARPTLRITHGLAWLATLLHPDAADKLKTWERTAAARLKLL
jgi:ABC-type Fe3+-hydroxamate transport system substrate-binding protein